MAQISNENDQGEILGSQASRSVGPFSQLLTAHAEPLNGFLVAAGGAGEAQQARDRDVVPLSRTSLRCSNRDAIHKGTPLQGVGTAESRDRIVTTKILIIDDCKLQRETLSAILVNAGAAIPSMAWDFVSVVEASGARPADVVLLSVTTRDKITLLRTVRDTCPQAKVVIVGVAEDDEADIIACAEAGAVGYHLRTESLFELLGLISRVADGESACSPIVSAVLLKHLSTVGSERRTGPVELNLTTREMQILQMLEMGLSNRDIADHLFIALHTVKNHVHAVLSKLGVGTRAEAAAYYRSLQ